MVEFHCSRKAHDGTPIVRDAVLQDYAEAVLQDYKPCLLKEPTKINADHFLESYLGVNLEYQYLYNEDGTPAIAGATVFNDERIQVFDERTSVSVLLMLLQTPLSSTTLWLMKARTHTSISQLCMREDIFVLIRVCSNEWTGRWTYSLPPVQASECAAMPQG